MQSITEQLFALQDIDYKQFHSKLMPTINPDVIIGVRTPELRKFAKQLAKSTDVELFLQELPHRYYEENNLHGFLIESIKEFDACIAALNQFLPYVDNWATCDMMSPKVMKTDLPELYEWVKVWIASGETYTVRFGVNMLMKYYLDETFLPEYPALVASIQSEEYYVKMVVAWYFATALAKQYDAVLPYIEEHRLDAWTHNKTIQKAVESYRILPEQKVFLKSLKIKE
ncbi:MAG: DNA alkylation repair protein [Lachnospiraceae bacterium]|nr:DNA alkylation repair protein [Lachnospiraceae bacterium]